MARTARVCARAGCTAYVIGSNYCYEHKPVAWESSKRNHHNPIGWDRTRAAVLYKYRNACYWCGEYANEVDHIIPVSRGGSHKMSNLVACCKKCNSLKNIKERTGQKWEPPLQRNNND